VKWLNFPSIVELLHEIQVPYSRPRHYIPGHKIHNTHDIKCFVWQTADLQRWLVENSSPCCHFLQEFNVAPSMGGYCLAHGLPSSTFFSYNSFSSRNRPCFSFHTQNNFFLFIFLQYFMFLFLTNYISDKLYKFFLNCNNHFYSLMRPLYV
jgi:hypothetical protein